MSISMQPNFRIFSHSHQPYKMSRPARAPATELGLGGRERTTDPITPLFGPGASPLLMAGHRQVISGIRKGSQNILIYAFIIITLDCQGGSQGRGISARAFSLARPGLAPPLNQQLQFRQNNKE